MSKINKYFFLSCLISCGVVRASDPLVDDLAKLLGKSSLAASAQGTAQPKSAPPSVSKPVKKVRKAKTQSVPVTPVKADDDALYKKAQKVSEKFLSNLDPVQEKFSPLLEEFQKNYAAKQKTTLDITDLSSRARVALLTQVIAHKHTTLPVDLTQELNYRRGFDKNYTALEAKPTDYWDTYCAPHNQNFRELVDKLPVTFKIGEFSYRLEVRMTPRQPGSGKLYGICSIHKADTYAQLQAPIVKAYEQQDEQKIEGFKLLLDYEVARRRLDGDAYGDLPVVISNALFLDHIGDSFDPYTGTVLGTDDRKDGLKTFMGPHWTSTTTQKDLRRVLNVFHDDDEDSGNEYVTTDEEELSDF